MNLDGSPDSGRVIGSRHGKNGASRGDRDRIVPARPTAVRSNGDALSPNTSSLVLEDATDVIADIPVDMATIRVQPAAQHEEPHASYEVAPAMAPPVFDPYSPDSQHAGARAQPKAAHFILNTHFFRLLLVFVCVVSPAFRDFGSASPFRASIFLFFSQKQD